jgi:hypothetical protein
MAQAWPQRGFLAPVQPDLDASLPYPYAINYGRTIMYRHVPSRAEIRQYEPWRFRAPESDASIDAATTVRDAGPRDAARPRLDELEGDPASPVIRRMLTGMYVALDRSVRDAARGERYWLTQSGGLVASERLSELRDAPTFQGVELDATPSANDGFSDIGREQWALAEYFRRFHPRASADAGVSYPSADTPAAMDLRIRRR